jgi:hypothetical protein
MTRMTLPRGMAMPMATAIPAVESPTCPVRVIDGGRQGRECLDADADAPAERHDRGGERYHPQLAPDHRVRRSIAACQRDNNCREHVGGLCGQETPEVAMLPDC